MTGLPIDIIREYIFTFLNIHDYLVVVDSLTSRRSQNWRFKVLLERIKDPLEVESLTEADIRRIRVVSRFCVLCQGFCYDRDTHEEDSVAISLDHIASTARSPQETNKVRLLQYLTLDPHKWMTRESAMFSNVPLVDHWAEACLAGEDGFALNDILRVYYSKELQVQIFLSCFILDKRTFFESIAKMVFGSHLRVYGIVLCSKFRRYWLRNHTQAFWMLIGQGRVQEWCQLIMSASGLRVCRELVLKVIWYGTLEVVQYFMEESIEFRTFMRDDFRTNKEILNEGLPDNPESVAYVADFFERYRENPIE